MERKIKNKEINREGKEMLEWLDENGLGIMSGIEKEDIGDFIYLGTRGHMIIDCIVENEKDN